jgi:hypothetical protein
VLIVVPGLMIRRQYTARASRSAPADRQSPMLEERKAAILKAVVEEYIQTAQPVGSGYVANAPGIGVSPATVRNELVQLEKQGYLQQPHTSAGRVPTDKGYRFFVDSLAMPTLAHAQADVVSSFFDHSHGELERLLFETTSLLADLTDCAAVVVGPTPQSATVRSIQVVRVALHAAVVVAVLSNGGVEKSTVELPDDFTDDAISDACALLTRTFVGGPLKLAEYGPEVPAVVARLAGAAMQSLIDIGSQDTDHADTRRDRSGSQRGHRFGDRRRAPRGVLARRRSVRGGGPTGGYRWRPGADTAELSAGVVRGGHREPTPRRPIERRVMRG